MKTAPRGGDAVVGYAWSLILGILAFSICMGVVTIIIGRDGGFSWVGNSGGLRFLLVLAGFILIMVGNGFFIFGEGLGNINPAIRQILKYIPAILGPLLIFSAFVLLNPGKISVVPILYKLPVYLGLLTGILAMFFIMKQNARNETARIEAETEFDQRNHQNHLNQIDTADVMTNMASILIYTNGNQRQDVREKALAKIKSRTDWQEELVLLLQTDGSSEAFTFLAFNEVEDKTLFPEAIRYGIFNQAGFIRESIRRCRGDYDLYSSRFLWEVERVLRTIDKFQGMGVDYRPAVQEMRNALDEPTSFKKPKLNATKILDDWLKKN